MVMPCQRQSRFWFMTTLHLCITSGLIEMSYSSSVDVTLFVRLRNFDGYLHKKNTLTSLTPVRYIIDCARSCNQNMECGSFFYLEEKLCQTHSVVFMTKDEAVAAPSTSYYQLTQARCPHERGYLLYRPVPVCYRYFEENVDGRVAKQHCKVNQSHLIDVKNPTISNHITNFIMASYKQKNPNIFVGANLVSRKWYWSDGTSVAWTNWGPREPNGPSTEDCAVLADLHQFKWNNIPCVGNSNPKPNWYKYNLNGYICQLDT